MSEALSQFETGFMYVIILLMAKHLLLFVSFFIVTQTLAQTSSEKILLSPSMAVNESGQGDATLLVDEQALSGDPLGGNSGSPQTYWFPGWQANIYPASAYIDLGQAYALSHIFLFDYTGHGNFTVEVGEPGNWTHLFTDGMSSYNTWGRHDVNVTTQYVRVTRGSAGGNMNEIVLYGSPANNTPVIGQITDQAVTVGGQLSIGLTASDSDGDPLTFSLDSGPGFVALTDLGNGTATIEVAPQAEDEGAYSIEVSVSDGRGGTDSTAFVLTVSGVPTGEVTKIPLLPSMVVNESGHGDATLLVDEQALSGDPLGGSSGNPQTYWFPGWQANIYPASAHIDLGQAYLLSHIFLFDYTGHGNFTIEVGEPGNWTHLFTDGMSSFNTWGRHDVNVTTQYVRVTRSSAGGNMNEIVLYGSPSSNSPPVIAAVAGQTVTVGSVISIPLSATDADSDPLTFSVTSGPSFITLENLGDTSASLQVNPKAGDEGSYNIQVNVSDGKGGDDSSSFMLTVEPVVVLIPTPPVDMVRNRPVELSP